MKRAILIAILVPAITTLSGCATKTYEREDAASAKDLAVMACYELDLELTKERDFIAYVNKDSKFDALDALAIVGDLGIGNELERKGALDGANKRIEKLQKIRAGKGCH
jgi:hypothetical protein